MGDAVSESETKMFNDRLASSTRPWDSRNRGDSGSLRRYKTTSSAGRAKNTNVQRQTRSSPPSPAARGPSSRKNRPYETKLPTPPEPMFKTETMVPR